MCPGAVLSEGVSVAGIVPSSFGSPLREFNRCHDATGKFCAGPRGLTGLRATPPATMHGRMDPAHAMHYDVTRAQQLGISVDVFAGTGSSGSARSLRNTVRVGYPQDRATPVETTDDEYKPSRASDLSVLRHEIGHVTDRGFGMRGDPSEARILGRTYPAWYLMEIGAWKAAVRDAPHNRVQWPRIYVRSEISTSGSPECSRATAFGHASCRMANNRLFDVFPHVSQSTRGGGPRRSRRSTKSRSLLSTTASASRAAMKIA